MIVDLPLSHTYFGHKLRWPCGEIGCRWNDTARKPMLISPLPHPANSLTLGTKIDFYATHTHAGSHTHIHTYTGHIICALPWNDWSKIELRSLVNPKKKCFSSKKNTQSKMPMSSGIDPVIRTLICKIQKSGSVSSVSVAEDTLCCCDCQSILI